MEICTISELKTELLKEGLFYSYILKYQDGYEYVLVKAAREKYDKSGEKSWEFVGYEWA